MTVVVVTRHGTTKTLHIPYEEVTSKGEPSLEQWPFVQFVERVDGDRNPLEVESSTKNGRVCRRIKTRAFLKVTESEKGVPRTHLEAKEGEITLPTDSDKIKKYNPLPEDKVEFSKDKSNKKIRVITRYLTQLSPLDYRIQPNDVFEEYMSLEEKPVRRIVRKLYHQDEPIGELIIEEYTNDEGRLVRKVKRRVVVVRTETERGIKKKSKQPVEEIQTEVIDKRAAVKLLLDDDFEQKVIALHIYCLTRLFSLCWCTGEAGRLGPTSELWKD